MGTMKRVWRLLCAKRNACYYAEVAITKKKKEYQSFSSTPGVFADTKRVLSVAEQAKRQRLLAALARSSQFLAIEKRIESILEKIAKSIGEAIQAKYVNFWDFTPDKKSVYIRAAYGMQQQYLTHSKSHPIPLGKGLQSAFVGKAIETGKVWASSNVQKDPRLPASWLPRAKEQGYHGIMCMPLKIKDRTIGGMCIYYKPVHEFEPFEMTITSIVANQAATAIENGRIFDELGAERLKTLAIVRSLNDGLIMYDLDDTVIFFNPRAEELLWLKAKDVVGKHPSKSFAGEDIYRKNLAAIHSLPQPDYENAEFTTDGPHRIVLLVTRIPVRDEKGVKIGTVQVLHDVTHEREVEQLKSNFLTTASHQLRTPLAGMKWALTALLNGEEGTLTLTQKEIVEKTSQANERLVTLVNDLLDVSRIEEGQFGYNFELTDLVVMTKDIVTEFKEDVARHGVTVSLTEPGHVFPQVSVDREKIKIAIGNLVDNAIKYTPKEGAITITFREEKDSLYLIVHDTGIGISLKEQTFIFNKFFRAQNAVIKETEGSGLGLYITKNIVEHHHGVIHFESMVDAGSTFTIQFPLSPENMPEPTPEKQAAQETPTTHE